MSAASQGAPAPDEPRRAAAAVPAWVDALGWGGTGLVLLAHFLANGGHVDDDGGLYHGLNLVGSAALAYLCVRRRVWQSVWLNAVWGAVAAVALGRAFLL